MRHPCVCHSQASGTSGCVGYCGTLNNPGDLLAFTRVTKRQLVHGFRHYLTFHLSSGLDLCVYYTHQGAESAIP